MEENTALSNNQPDTIKGHVWMWPDGEKNAADLCHLSWRAAEMVFGMSVECAFPSRHASTQLFTSKHWFLLSVLTQVSPNPHAEHTHQWSGKSMACNWATWSSEHTHMQCPAVWNETNERSAEKQMTLRVQRSGVSASGMSHLSLIRPLLTNTPNFAVGTIPKMSRCLVQEQMLGAQNHQRWMERERGGSITIQEKRNKRDELWKDKWL